ncbi:Flavin-containing monooxygenase ustF2 [Cladobotryum mycophilum]|uniref:Flavin-containing monooxygenase ustF2 n=1 Tax=Cladobotryum mycophilum TaxID=491253 RepID=A0ABR0SW97_9HYPO
MTGLLSPNGPFDRAKTVAVIGAGISGVTSAAHLLKQGLQVTVFERSYTASGVWQYDPRIPDDPSYPSEIPSIGDYQTSSAGQFSLGTPPPETTSTLKQHRLSTKNDDALEISFAPPTPCYAGLTNNVPTTTMVSSLAPWPEGTEEIIRHEVVAKYVQGIAFDYGVDDVTKYNTRVEQVTKSPDGKTWLVRTIRLEKRDVKPRIIEKLWQFDAVVVATGHYSLPRIPNVPGLKEWKKRYGDRVIHSKQYRDPELLRDKNVFIMGCGVSSLNICQELEGVAKHVYQSARGGIWDLPVSMLGKNARRVGGIESFELPDDASNEKLDKSAPIPGTIVLKDGEVVSNLDQLILATGYITSFPFLSDLHEDDKPAEDAGPRTLVTREGNMTHNLHRDMFYIEDPTLAFIGVPYHNATFSLFDFQAQVVARVLAGKAQLPSRDEMRNEYEKRIEEKGVGRLFHSMIEEGAEQSYVQELVDWVNKDAERHGLEPMKGHTEPWLKAHKAHRQKRAAIRSGEPDAA